MQIKTINQTIQGPVPDVSGLILQPIVGTVCLTVDALVLNTIEFWTGDNPIAANTQIVKGQDGRYYTVKTSKKGYEIVAPTGEITLLTYNKIDNTWSMTQDGLTKEILRFNADGTIQAVLQNGETITVTNDEAGLQQVREAVLNEQNLWALR